MVIYLFIFFFLTIDIRKCIEIKKKGKGKEDNLRSWLRHGNNSSTVLFGTCYQRGQRRKLTLRFLFCFFCSCIRPTGGFFDSRLTISNLRKPSRYRLVKHARPMKDLQATDKWLLFIIAKVQGNVFVQPKIFQHFSIRFNNKICSGEKKKKLQVKSVFFFFIHKFGNACLFLFLIFCAWGRSWKTEWFWIREKKGPFSHCRKHKPPVLRLRGHHPRSVDLEGGTRFWVARRLSQVRRMPAVPGWKQQMLRPGRQNLL